MLANIFLIVPVYNAKPYLDEFLNVLSTQGLVKKNILFVDSSSSDGTGATLRDGGYNVLTVLKKEFNHGATRQAALESLNGAEIVVFLTQDAILKDSSAISLLVRAFDNCNVAMAYGRQLPRKHAGPIEAFARFRNYPENSEIRSLADKELLGVKTVFCSNSFAAYRVKELLAVGGFPRTSFAEDQLVAAKLLLAGKQVAYVAGAQVYHSHDYSLQEEFQRYKMVGIFHGENRWLINAFGAAEGEGLRFVIEEMKFLSKVRLLAIPNALLRNAAKYLGYRLGSTAVRQRNE